MADAGKKGKMTKAEKEKQKKEELERKAQEEEALRLQAIEEAKVKKREEASVAVEKIKLENEERRKRRAEMTEMQDILSSIHFNLRQENINRRNKAKWSRYMRCDGSPDPVNQGQINTYINLRLEDKTRNDSVSVLADSLLDLSLIEELELLMRESEPEELSEKEIFLHKETIKELQGLIATKLDLATLQILCDATELADQETGNLQHIIKNSQICLCVWGNIMKNPRVKSFEFQEIQFAFDIPRVLGLSDCAVRLMNTKFDHLSPSSKALIPRLKKKEIAEPPEEPKTKVEEEVKEETEKPKEEPKEDEFTIPDVVVAPVEEELKNEEEQEIEEVLEEDYPDPPSPEPAEYEDFDEEDDVVDLRAYDVLGGIYHFNLLQLPPQPKTVGAWTITQLVDPPEISVLDYAADPPVPHEEGKKIRENKDDKPLIGVHMLLPTDAVFLETPTIARWDYDRKLWVTKGFSDQNLNETTRIFSFKSSHFGTFCLLQDTHINMPFQSWEIRPHKMNSCLLTITAAILEIEIEIQNGLCCLSQPKERQELSNIIDRWVTPQELIKMMKSAGVNIFPNEDSSKFVVLQVKHLLTEDRIYQNMALTASSIAYTWSKWNAERGPTEIVFQAAETLEDEPLLEESWALFLATKRRVTKLRSTEFDESLSQGTDQDFSEYKSNLYHLMMDSASKPAQDRIQETSVHFIDCVYQLLKATKVLTYS